MPKAKPTARRLWIALLAFLAVAGIAGLLWVFDGAVPVRPADAPTAAAAREAREAGLQPASAPIPTGAAAPDVPQDVEHSGSPSDEALIQIQALETQIRELQQKQVDLEARLGAQADRMAKMQSTILGLSSMTQAPAAPIPAHDTLDEDLAKLGAVEQEGTWRVTIGEPEIRFEAGQTDLPESLSLLSRIGHLLVEHPGLHARIEVHTDNKGLAARNLEISQARAQSVLAALVSMGVAPDRLAADGFGGSRPVGDNRTVAARQRNRRIEITLLTP
jgi:outer membrane protein OmpA-like peptidoglycan-associated protein